MTELEFVQWSSNVEARAEWVDGEVQIMNAVELDHAKFQAFLQHLVRGFVDEHGLGDVYAEPYQVRLPEQKRRRAPDLFFLSGARQNLLERTQCNGAPDLVVEILSPESQSRDRRVKFLEYQAAGVAEYWLPDPTSRTFEVYTPGRRGKYKQVKAINGAIHSLVLPGLFVRPEWVYQLTYPRVAPLLHAMALARQSASTPPAATSDKRR